MSILIERRKNDCVKKFLGGYLEIKHRRKLLDDEIREQYARALDISVHLKEISVQSSGSLDGFQNAVVEAIDKTRNLQAVVNELQEKERLILAAIESVGDETEKLILTMRYIKGWSWAKISIESGYAETRPFEIHGRALQKIRKWMDENL